MSKMAVTKKSIVIKGYDNATTGLNVDGRNINVDSKRPHFISDSGLASEIESRHGAGKKGEVSKDVVVIKDVPMYTEDGHNYTFGSTRKYREAWERLHKRLDDTLLGE